MLALRIAIWALAIVSLRGVRRAYAGFVLLAFLYFPARVGFELHPRACEAAMSLSLARLSLQNYPHIVMLAAFFLITSAQFRTNRRSAFVYGGLLTLMMGVLIELGEAVSGKGNCRLRDLVPDTAGALLGGAVLTAWDKAAEAVRRRHRP